MKDAPNEAKDRPIKHQGAKQKATPREKKAALFFASKICREAGLYTGKSESGNRLNVGECLRLALHFSEKPLEEHGLEFDFDATEKAYGAGDFDDNFHQKL